MEGDAEGEQRLMYSAYELDGVGEDDLLVGLALGGVVAVVADELHLPEDGGLARLAGTEEEHTASGKAR